MSHNRHGAFGDVKRIVHGCFAPGWENDLLRVNYTSPWRRLSIKRSFSATRAFPVHLPADRAAAEILIILAGKRQEPVKDLRLGNVFELAVTAHTAPEGSDLIDQAVTLDDRQKLLLWMSKTARNRTGTDPFAHQQARYDA